MTLSILMEILVQITLMLQHSFYKLVVMQRLVPDNFNVTAGMTFADKAIGSAATINAFNC